MFYVRILKMELPNFKLHRQFHFYSIVKLKFSKTIVMISITCILAGSSQSAPVPARREYWNPYYYPTVRSLSIPPPPPQTKVTSTSTSTTQRPRIIKQVSFRWAERRTSRSMNSTNQNNGDMKGTAKDQLKFDVGNVTAVGYALNDFIRSAEVLVRELLVSTNGGFLKVIGQVDQGISRFQKRLQNTGFRLVFAGQKAAAQTYEALPPFVNKLIQRLGTPDPEDARSRDKLTGQLNDAVKNLRQLKKMLVDALEEHEKDFHNVFQDRFSQANMYLGVPELPRKPLAWYP